MRGHLEGLDVHDRDIVLVLDVNIQMALAVAGGLLRRAAEINRADDRAVLGVNDRGVGRNVNWLRWPSTTNPQLSGGIAASPCHRSHG